MLIALLALTLAAPRSMLAAADTADCAEAARYLRADRHAIAIVERDTVDDWRTGKRVTGCRITSVVPTVLDLRREAPAFYERLRAAGWTRTPDPRDSPNEGSLRFRWKGSDCLFNLNAQALLNTDAEARVNDALPRKDGEDRYQVYVMCMPAMPAKP